jgi:hypothetical protein
MGYTRPTPTPVELWEGWSHVVYEVLMLSNAAVLIEDEEVWDRDWGWRSKTLYWATLESFLPHTRSLMDFVCPPSGWETQKINERGIFAADYCTTQWKAQPWPTLRAKHKQISIEIEHLTFDRPAVGRNWPYVQMLRKLRAMLLDFVDQADLMDEDIREELRAILARGVRVSAGGVPIPTSAIVSLPAGVSRATTGMIDPTLVEQPQRAKS